LKRELIAVIAVSLNRKRNENLPNAVSGKRRADSFLFLSIEIYPFVRRTFWFYGIMVTHRRLEDE